MAEYLSDVAAKQADPTPKNMATAAELTPNTKILRAVLTSTAAWAAADTLKVIKVPKGTRVFASRGKIRTSAAVAATAFTVDAGYYIDASTLDIDKFATALNINTGAGEFALDEVVEYEFTDEGWITITPNTVTGAVTAGVTLTCEFVVNFPN